MLAAGAAVRLRDFGLPAPDDIPAAAASLLDHAQRIENFRRSLPT